MEKLNNKIKNGRTQLINDAQMVGNYAYDSTEDKLRRLVCNTNGALSVDVHGGSVGSGDLKARTNIADPSTSTFLRCTADGDLELTAELNSGDFKSMGSEDGSTSGLQRQLRVDGNGRLSVDINSGIPTKTDGTTGHSPATGVGLIGFDSGTARAVACDSQGHLQCDILNQKQEGQLAGFQDITNTGSVIRLHADSAGRLDINVVGNTASDGTGSAKHLLADSEGRTVNLIGKVADSSQQYTISALNSGTLSGFSPVDTNGFSKCTLCVVASALGSGNVATVMWGESSGAQRFICNGLNEFGADINVRNLQTTLKADSSSVVAQAQALFFFDHLPNRHLQVGVFHSGGSPIDYTLYVHLHN